MRTVFFRILTVNFNLSDRFTNIDWHTPTQSTFLLSDQKSKQKQNQILKFVITIFFEAVIITDSKFRYNGF